MLITTLCLSASLAATNSYADEISDYVEACETLGWSGVVLVRRRGKALHHDGHGFADRVALRPVEPDTRFEIASISKPITAAAVLVLVDEGDLDLDESIGQLLPGVPAHAREITVRHLLSHTSGMPRTAGGGHGSDLEKAVAGYLSTPPVREPGQKDEYWNGGYALLAGIVETIGKQPFEDFVREHVFEPAGMDASGFTGDDIDASLQAIGYESGQRPRLATEHPYQTAGWHYRGMGAVVSTAGDMVRFIEALRGGDIVEKRIAALMWEPTVGPYGLGFGTSEAARGSTRVSHGGDVRGFHSYVTTNEDLRIDVVVLSNVGPFQTYRMTWNLEALATGDDPPYSMPPERANWREGDAVALVGDWHTSDDRTYRIDLGPNGGLVGRWSTRGDDRADPGREFIEWIAAGETEKVRSRTDERFASHWPQQLTGAIWSKHVEAFGALESIEVDGVDETDSGSVTIYFTLNHERGEAHAKMVLTNGRVNYLDLGTKGEDAASDVLPQTFWMPVGKRELVRYDWSKNEVAGRLKLSGDPAKTSRIELEGTRLTREK
ncbi:MAG: serine hydrolase [Planctomycetota bacterium]